METPVWRSEEKAVTREREAQRRSGVRGSAEERINEVRERVRKRIMQGKEESADKKLRAYILDGITDRDRKVARKKIDDTTEDMVDKGRARILQHEAEGHIMRTATMSCGIPASGLTLGNEA